MSTSKISTNLNLESLAKTNIEELKRYLVAIYTMECYSCNTCYNINKMERDFAAIGDKYLSKMPFNYKDRIKRLNDAMKLNQDFLDQVVKIYKPSEEYYQYIRPDELQSLSYKEVGHLDYAVFMYIVRDWTIDRKQERDSHYKPMIDEVKKYLPSGGKILIPGAALNRLGYELAKCGYDIEAGEYSFFNVMLSDFMFNHSTKDKYCLQPLIRCFNNYLTEDAVFKKFSFPDEEIDQGIKGSLHVSVGDFTKIYNDQPGQYDCVITCFFIDTAKNILEYIEVIEKVLKKGGIWINFGPLSYHWTGYPDVISIELPYDKLKESIIKYGFEYLYEDVNKTVIYCEIDDFMKNDVYRCISFTARKK